MYQHFATYYDRIFPINRTSFSQLGTWMSENRKALDLGCATGHLVHVMQQHKMKAIGVDLDSKMIEIAQSNYPTLSFIQADMVEYLKDQKDIFLITCLGNTIPHLNHEQLNLFFERVASALAKDGMMIIQLLNYDKLLYERPDQLPIIKHDELTFYRSYQYQKDHVIFETRLIINDHETKGSTLLYPYGKEELKKMIENHQLRALCFQNLSLDPWSIQSSHQTWLITHESKG